MITMDRLARVKARHNLRRQRIRSRIAGTAERPRLNVYISNRHISAQLIDDSKHKTLAAVTTVGQKAAGNLTERAKWVGSEIAKRAKAAKVTNVVMDRNGRLYHGRVKALADSARESGLEF